MIQLVAFDLDGTLVNSSHDLAESTNAMLVDFGGRTLDHDVVVGLVGEGAAVLVRRALERAGLDPDTPNALERFLLHYDARLLDTTRPYPGMVSALNALAATRRLAVLTNKPERATIRILRGLDLDALFTDVIGGDSALGRKPDPAGLRELAARAGTSAAHTILVGDSPVDLATARRAGARICLARYGFGYRFDGHAFQGDERFIDEPAEVVAVIDEIG
jgi:phosphoglycolate phosphatase